MDRFPRWRAVVSDAEVWVVRTGIGVERAAAAAAAAGDARDFALFVNTGCAGGLAPGLAAGDLVVATGIQTPAGTAGAGWNGESPAARDERALALAAAGAAGLRCREGGLYCSPAILGGAAAKRQAAENGAVAVEMESAPVAARAAAAGVPFLAVRAILDRREDDLDLPDTLLDPDTGAVRTLAVAAHLAAHPHAFAELAALRSLERAARASLERFFRGWFAAIAARGAEAGNSPSPESSRP